MKSIIKTVVSYLSAFFAGMYGLCFINGEIDLFMVIGFIACVGLCIACAPIVPKKNFKKV